MIAAGMQLIASQGYNATCIDAVLKRVGVPKDTFNCRIQD